VTTLQRTQVCFGTPPFLQLTGKGRKERTVPLWPHTSRTLQAWFAE
jgi:integrase